MKTRIFIIGLCILISACNKQPQNSKVITYAPEEKSDSMSNAERDQALANQRALLNGRLDSVSYSRAVKLTIMVPQADEKLSECAAETLGSKMLQITASNGIAGYGGDPSFVFAAMVTPQKEGKTSTAPQKSYLTYLINFYVANITTGDIFGSMIYEVMGVGDTNEQASINAMQSLKVNEQLNEMLSTSSKQIITWYESHINTVKQKVEQYAKTGEYGKAYAIISSIPEEATNCFAYASKNRASIYEKYADQLSLTYLNNMRAAIASSPETYNPEAGAYIAVIPHTSKIYQQALNEFENYVKKIEEVADVRRAHEIYMEEEQLAIAKIRAEAELRANETLKIQAETQQKMADAPNAQTSTATNASLGGSSASLFSFGVSKLMGYLFM